MGWTSPPPRTLRFHHPNPAPTTTNRYITFPSPSRVDPNVVVERTMEGELDQETRALPGKQQLAKFLPSVTENGSFLFSSYST
jgi:hypothetical protein